MQLAQLKNVGFYRNQRWLVQDIDLTINKGEIVTLIGPNGSGKTMIAKLLLGILKADTGEAKTQAGIKIGYMPQNLALDWTLPLSVRRLMQLTMRLSEKIIMQSLARVGVEHLVEEQLRKLSGGELQRVLLARALSLKPDLLVLDEPVNGVDVAGQSAMYELIATLRDELNCGILLISHDLHIVMAKSNKVVCVNRHVCCEGKPEIVAQDPQYKTLFNKSGMALYSHDPNHNHSHKE